ncbi:8-amino-7-oxononanoate synthase [Hypoxylon cercidicola]|nr:8-amino-7-oxononanoate synthase [Hypoxylon cercidicola]
MTFSSMYSDKLIRQWCLDHRPRSASMQNESAFDRNLEHALDTRRQAQSLLALKPRWDESVADFTSADFLSLTRTGQIREVFLAEISSHPNFELGASGSRLQFGNYTYINEVEQEIADFHGSEVAYITQSTYGANLGVLSSVPLPGDAIVYDEFVHASSHEGFQLSVAEHKIAFRHNDPDDLREVLARLKHDYPVFETGTRSVLICVESFYSMDGDVCQLRELVQVANDEFPLGNAQFIMDEAHSIGVIGEKGRGLVSILGLEKAVAIRIHAASKALGAVGGVILCNKSVRSSILNNARSLTFSCAPSFPMVASIRAGYQLLIKGETEEAQARIQRNVEHLLRAITSNSVWDDAVDEGIISIPFREDWEDRPFHTHIVPLCTRPRHEMFLFFHLLENNINAYPFAFPIVPKGKSRVRLVVHAHNTASQIEKLASTICDWAQEMLEIERSSSTSTLPSAARKVYEMQAALLD